MRKGVCVLTPISRMMTDLLIDISRAAARGAARAARAAARTARARARSRAEERQTAKKQAKKRQPTTEKPRTAAGDPQKEGGNPRPDTQPAQPRSHAERAQRAQQAQPHPRPPPDRGADRGAGAETQPTPPDRGAAQMIGRSAADLPPICRSAADLPPISRRSAADLPLIRSQAAENGFFFHFFIVGFLSTRRVNLSTNGTFFSWQGLKLFHVEHFFAFFCQLPFFTFFPFLISLSNVPHGTFFF